MSNDLVRNVCPSCGGPVVRDGNFSVCEYCHTRWQIDLADDIHAVDRANAWAALRASDFEKAEELFDAIILTDRNNYEAYWGRALSKASITYVNDMHEGKKVPTCNNLGKDSFLKFKDVEKAIELAPAGISEEYSKQAEKIEKIRIEWLERASKEPPYDIFISFKDSDKDRGIDRTQDSVDAQDLYNLLIQKNYRVFFSRISLRGKIGEQYEPYIYNAIKTAKVMIVFGEKPEYFSSTWIKNEWLRYKKRIDDGEKNPNSLVVVCKGMNPSDLPATLRSRQCINLDNMGAETDLINHIEKVIAATQKTSRIDKIEIKGGKVSAKATKIGKENLETRELGSSSAVETNISERQQLDIVKMYVQNQSWREADKLLDDIFSDNVNCGTAAYYKLLTKHKQTSMNQLLHALKPKFNKQDMALIEKALNYSPKADAERFLVDLYEAVHMPEETYEEILKLILPYEFAQRTECINKAFGNIRSAGRFGAFKILLTSLSDNEVDRYISEYISYAVVCTDDKIKAECIQAVLAVDNGDAAALRIKFDMNWGKAKLPELISLFEERLKYSDKQNTVVTDWLNYNYNTVETDAQSEFALNVIKYYTDDVVKITNPLSRLGYHLLTRQFYEKARKIFEIIISVQSDNAEAYWGICLAKAEAASDVDVVFSKTPLTKIPEYNKYLTLVDESRQRQCMEIVMSQKMSKKNKRQKYNDSEQTKTFEKKRESHIKSWKVSAIVLAVLFIPILYFFVAPAINAISGHYWSYVDNWRIKRFEVPSHITVIEEHTIVDYDNKTLQHLVINEGVVEIRSMALTQIKNLKTLTLPNSLQVLDSYIPNLEVSNYNEYDNAYYIGNDINPYLVLAKAKSTDITSCIIHPDTRFINSEAFRNCVNLSDIDIHDGIVGLGYNVFDNCPGVTVYENGVIYVDNWLVDSVNDYAFSIRGTVTVKAGTVGIANDAFAWQEDMKGVNLPEGLKYIGKGAFSSCDEMTEISIPDSVQTIGGECFESCVNLKTVKLPSGLSEISYGLFSSCNSLTDIEIPDSVTKIGDEAFMFTHNLQSITIPEGVTYIGRKAFSYSDLRSIVLPTTLTEIAKKAFDDCDSLLEIKYLGSEDMWKDIKIRSKNRPLKKAEIEFA